MATQWVLVASLPIIFFVGALSTVSPVTTIALIVLSALAALVGKRFRPRNLYSTYSSRGPQPDWVLVLLPTAIAIRSLNEKASLLVTGLLVVAALLRKPEGKFRIQPGPLILFSVACAIVVCRPVHALTSVFFLLVGALILRLITTVDARRITASLIDGCGLYLAANVLAYSAGYRSPAQGVRIGGLIESTGFVRTIYPFTLSINIPPIIAAIYVATFAFLILEPGWIKRLLRTLCLLAGVIVLIGAGTRTPMVTAAVLLVAVVCFPTITRWLGQSATLLAIVSAFVLPSIVSSLLFVIAPILSLAPGRATSVESILSLQDRDVVWDRTIRYWANWVNDVPELLFGFGVNGQYRSGASQSYKDLLSSILKNPELAFVHNSFLQQLFDGGLAGFLLLAVALYWTAQRLAKRRIAWGIWGVSAIIAFATLLLSGITEVSIAPGPVQDTFWLVAFLVGVSCQENDTKGEPADGAVTRADDDSLPLRSLGAVTRPDGSSDMPTNP